MHVNFKIKLANMSTPVSWVNFAVTSRIQELKLFLPEIIQFVVCKIGQLTYKHA
jgi:hypothetical protein